MPTNTNVSDKIYSTQTAESDASQFPNPTKDGACTINLDLINEGPVEVGIFNIAGNQVYSEKFKLLDKVKHPIYFFS